MPGSQLSRPAQLSRLLGNEGFLMTAHQFYQGARRADWWNHDRAMGHVASIGEPVPGISIYEVCAVPWGHPPSMDR